MSFEIFICLVAVISGFAHLCADASEPDAFL
jgi:hypothetical protein